MLVSQIGSHAFLQKLSKRYRLQRKSPKNYLVIVYFVKKFIQSLKSSIQVNRLLKIKPYHLALLNDRSSAYKDGIDIGNARNHLRFQSREIAPGKIRRTGQKFVTIILVSAFLCFLIKF